MKLVKIQYSTLQLLWAYGIGVLLLTIYGVEVCPYIDGLPYYITGGILLGSFGVALIIRQLTFPKVLPHINIAGEDTVLTFPLFIAELAVWLIAALFTTYYNIYQYDFPFESGMKVLLGSFTLGFFTSTYFVLKHEAALMVLKSKAPTTVTKQKYFSITAKFQTFSMVSYAVIVTIILLLIKKDLATLAQYENIFQALIIEIIFVFAIIFIGSIFILRRYSQNIKLSFELHLKALDQVSQGNYQVHIPMVSNDELSLIAQHGNRMLEGLKEKERVKQIFNKYMSPDVVQAILSSEAGDRLGGEEVEVAVLFTDLRNFTGISEQLSPHELVQLLNEYFSIIVQHVHEYNGVLDKFIGDAAMAVFGLGGITENAGLDAVETARAIRTSLQEFNEKLSQKGITPLNNGVGIHFGTVIAGNIGATDRLEYTIIGDVVNIASRLESLTKVLQQPIIFSDVVMQQLPIHLQQKVTDLGKQHLKGKSDKLQLFGLNS